MCGEALGLRHHQFFSLALLPFNCRKDYSFSITFSLSLSLRKSISSLFLSDGHRGGARKTR